ncbi:MAG TPA: DUF1805 domain-containing protein [Candidatus Sulfotelmatobacter sp.]|jgi:uncharacterized protein YunC (DUF1805 family)|nr:DUF1805 domain-containing protein [Candidatus Sulfotelmatobacter sp.]
MNLESVEKHHIALKSPLLVIKAPKGVLGCGYLNVETFNQTGEAGVIITGVRTHDDMMKAKVVAVSNTAKAMGITPGMTGAEALDKLS